MTLARRLAGWLCFPFHPLSEVCHGRCPLGIPGAAWRPRRLRRREGPGAHRFQSDRRAGADDVPVLCATPRAEHAASRHGSRDAARLRRRPRRGVGRVTGRSARMLCWCPQSSAPRDNRGADHPIRVVPVREKCLRDSVARPAAWPPGAIAGRPYALGASVWLPAWAEFRQTCGSGPGLYAARRPDAMGSNAGKVGEAQDAVSESARHGGPALRPAARASLTPVLHQPAAPSFHHRGAVGATRSAAGARPRLGTFAPYRALA
jgi:hypothetical protein